MTRAQHSRRLFAYDGRIAIVALIRPERIARANDDLVARATNTRFLARAIDQTLRRCQSIALQHCQLDISPVDWFAINTNSEPTLLSNVARQIISIRLGAGAIDVLSKLGLDADSHDAIWIVATEKIREQLATNAIVDEVSVIADFNLKQLRANRTESLDPRVVHQRWRHDDVPSAAYRRTLAAAQQGRRAHVSVAQALGRRHDVGSPLASS